MPTKSFKTQLAPTKEQTDTFEWWGEIRNGVYNWGRSVRQAAWKRQGKSLSHYDLDGLVTDKKKSDGFSHWGDPPRRVLYYALRDVDAAFQHFFRRLEEGETPGYPNRANPRSRRFTVYGVDVSIREDAIRIPKAGWVQLEESGYIPTDAEGYSEVTVKRDADTWMVSVQAQVGDPHGRDLPPKTNGTLAVHPGVRTWVALGRQEEGVVKTLSLPMNEMGRMEAKIDRLHRKLSRRERGSKGEERARRKLAKAYRRLRHIREDATHKATAYICYERRPERILIQDWDLSALAEQEIEGVPRKVERRIRRRMANANIGEFLRQLKYKSDWAGIEIEEVDIDVPVSKECAACGYENKDLDGARTLHCGGCGREINRELNAIENYFLHQGDKVAQG